MNRSFIHKLVLVVVLVTVPVLYSALIDITVNTDDTTIPEIGQEFQITIVADIDESSSIISWGLDLNIDPEYLEIVGPIETGDYWLSVNSSVGDGDGLAGLSFPNAVSGDKVVLFVVTLKAIKQGVTDITVTYDDLEYFEGFWLQGAGNGYVTDVKLSGQDMTILPEPATIVLLGSGLLICMKRK